jgi:hypothetical protein
MALPHLSREFIRRLRRSDFCLALPAATQNSSVRGRRKAPLAEWRDLKNESGYGSPVDSFCQVSPFGLEAGLWPAPRTLLNLRNLRHLRHPDQRGRPVEQLAIANSSADRD